MLFAKGGVPRCVPLSWNSSSTGEGGVVRLLPAVELLKAAV